VQIESDRAIGRVGDGGHAELRVGVVDVGIVGLEVGLGQGEGRVLVGRERIVDRYGGVVDGRNGDGDGGDVGVSGAVVGFVGEAVGAVEVGGRRVAERAVCVECQRTVSWTDHLDRGDGGTIDVGVVAQHTGGTHREDGVLV